MTFGQARPGALRCSRVLVVGLIAYLGLLAFLSLRPVADTAFDRAVHATGDGYLHLPAYAVLSFLATFVLGGSLGRVAAAGAMATAYGWLLEVAQLAAPTRHFNGLGLGLDAAGAFSGCLAAIAVRVAQAHLSRRTRRAPAPTGDRLNRSGERRRRPGFGRRTGGSTRTR